MGVFFQNPTSFTVFETAIHNKKKTVDFSLFLNGESQGTRLGLSIVKHIAALYGGKIGVENEVGKGSVFSVWLPLYSEETHPKGKKDDANK